MSDPQLSMADIAGRWASDEPGDPHLTIRPDGTIFGSDGCNGIGTTGELSDGVLTIASWIATARACMGVDDWLRSAHTAVFDGETMTVRNRAGAVIGTLTRTDDEVTKP